MFSENYFNDPNFQVLSKEVSESSEESTDYPDFKSNLRTFQNCRYFNPYTAECLYCHRGYALDSNGLICSRVIDYCKTYKTSYECQVCEINYQLFIDLSKPHFEVYCVPSVDIPNCKIKGNAIYLNPITKYETAINGCLSCLNGFTSNGSSCTFYSFASAANCLIFN